MHLYLSFKKKTGTTDRQPHGASTYLELVLLSKNKPILFFIWGTQLLISFMAYVSVTKCTLEQVALQYSFGKHNSIIIVLRQPQTCIFLASSRKQCNMFPILLTVQFVLCDSYRFPYNLSQSLKEKLNLLKQRKYCFLSVLGVLRAFFCFVLVGFFGCVFCCCCCFFILFVCFLVFF